MGVFVHYELNLIKPDFDSRITDLIIKLDLLRHKKPAGSTLPELFTQVKNIYQTMESLGSARIEGNNTTLAELIEEQIKPSDERTSNLDEIDNINAAISFIDEHIDHINIDNRFIRELHSLVVQNLAPAPKGEGDATPGAYRKFAVQITKSTHKPPELEIDINRYMQELVDFINREDLPKYDLIKTALVHHRFMWIHPFGNGNGRTGRLLTYAMLLKQGFSINRGNLINPTAIFCLDRNQYNRFLSAADTGDKEGLNQWCEFVLDGLQQEIDKIDKLLNFQYLSREILLPSIQTAFERKFINKTEFEILRLSIQSKDQVVNNQSIKTELYPTKSPQQISNILNKLVGLKLLAPSQVSPRKYYLRFSNNFLLRYVMKEMQERGFVYVAD